MSNMQTNNLPYTIKLNQHQYDNPYNVDGTRKSNVFLGEFQIIQVLTEDYYDSLRIGIMDDNMYLIVGTEVSYHDAGTVYEIYRINQWHST